MALALRLFLLLLLAVILPARAAQAAPWPAQGADWYAGNGFTAPWLEGSLDPLGPPTGPPKEKTQGEGENKSLKSSELLDQILSEVESHREMKAEAEAFPRGSSSSVQVSAERREAMPDWDRDINYLEALDDNHFNYLEDAEAKDVGEGDTASQPISKTEPLGSKSEFLGDHEDAADSSRHVPNSQKAIASGVCQGTRCFFELMAIVAGGEFVVLFCSIGILYCWKRYRWHRLEEKLKAGGWSRDLYSQKSHSSSSDSDQFLFAPPSSMV